MQYYSSDDVSFNLFNPGELFTKRSYPKDAALSPTGFIADIPKGMAQALRWAHQFRLPIYITENGVEDAEITCDRPICCTICVKYGWPQISIGRSRVISTGPRLTILNGSGDGHSVSACGNSTRKPRSGLAGRSADIYAAICRENGIRSEDVNDWHQKFSVNYFPAKGIKYRAVLKIEGVI